MKTHTILTCKQCKTPYEWMPNRGKIYCSWECRLKDKEQMQTHAKQTLIPRYGKDNNLWKGGIPTCTNCGGKMGWYNGKLCRTCWAKSIQSEGHPRWVGDKADYDTVHSWVRRHLGRVKECVYCGDEGKIQWASISHHAKRDLDDYIPLCVACHSKYDKEARI